MQENINFENKLSKDIKIQLENLGLNQNQIEGKILDVGAGKALFARTFKNNKDTEITSIDQHIEKGSEEFVIKANALDLPFEENSFDMVVSHASMPHIFLSLYSFEHPEESKKEIESAVMKSLSEIVRVLKNGKKAYLAPIPVVNNYESQKCLTEAIINTLEKLKKQDIKVDFKFLRTEINPRNKEKTDLFRLIIEKPL
jgi:ubiquinone/menaquinone biosynthesis C-methylase UbiE